MSLRIFERAEFYVQKIMDIKDIHTELLDVLNKSSGLYTNNYNTLKNKYFFNKSTIRIRDSRTDIFETFLMFNPGLTDLYDSFWFFNGIDKKCNRYVTRELINVSEFKEDLDFQLSTVMTDKELYEYYICCILYTKGFNGYIHRMISPLTLNAIRTHINRLKETHLGSL